MTTLIGPAPAWRRTALLAVALVCPGVLVLLRAMAGLTPVQRSALLFFGLAALVLALPPRGILVARTWVVAYLTVQFPVRALYLLSPQQERPPIYAEASPGVGLQSALGQALDQASLGLVALGLGTCLVRAAPRRGSAAQRLDRRRWWLLLAVGSVLLPVERAASSVSSGGGSFIISLPGLMTAGAAASVCFVFVQSPRRHVAAVVAALAYAIARVPLLHSKLTLLACLMSLALSWTVRGGRHRTTAGRVVRTGVAVALAVTAALYVFAAAGGRTKGHSFAASLDQGVQAAVSRSYGVDAVVASNRYLDAGGASFQGQTLTELSWSWIPRQLWPTKPKSFSIRFGEDVFSFSPSAGREFFAPSYTGEWLLNFGTLGIVIGWLLFGLLVGWVDGMPSRAHRVLWLLPLVHLVEGSFVAQLWLAAPFLLGGYLVLRGQSRSTQLPFNRFLVSKT